MPDIRVDIAIIGRPPIMPGTHQVAVESVQCLLSAFLRDTIVDNDRRINIDVSDCTLFHVRHLDVSQCDLTSDRAVRQVFHRTLDAVSELLIWMKAHDKIGVVSSYARQCGTTDVKAFFATDGDVVAGWTNPTFDLDRGASAMMTDSFRKLLVENTMVGRPLPILTRRVFGVLDLINLGFYTEAFISMFSLVDDLTQAVMKAGLAKGGLPGKKQEEFMRAIKENRLNHFLTNMAVLLGWQSLAEGDEELFRCLVKVNEARNQIMHAGHQLGRHETLEATDVLLRVVHWLRSNPFGYCIAAFPELRPAEPEFGLCPIFASDPDKTVG